MFVLTHAGKLVQARIMGLEMEFETSLHSLAVKIGFVQLQAGFELVGDIANIVQQALVVRLVLCIGA